MIPLALKNSIASLPRAAPTGPAEIMVTTRFSSGRARIGTRKPPECRRRRLRRPQVARTPIPRTTWTSARRFVRHPRPAEAPPGTGRAGTRGRTPHTSSSGARAPSVPVPPIHGRVRVGRRRPGLPGSVREPTTGHAASPSVHVPRAYKKKPSNSLNRCRGSDCRGRKFRGRAGGTNSRDHGRR